MKKLILSITALLLFLTQVNAQITGGTTEAIPAPKAGSATKVSGKARQSVPAPATAPTISGTTNSVGVGASIPSPSSTYSVSGTITGVGVATGPAPQAFSYSTSGTVSATGTGVYTWNDNQDQSDDPMKTKTFTKSFVLDKNDKVNLFNMYGSITIKTWDKNEIKVDADIKAYANTEGDAQKLLDDVSIKAAKDGDQVTFKTNMEEHNGNWGRGSYNGKKWRREVKIYYTVYMPKNNALNLSQEYGSIIMDDYNGPTSIKVQYGNLTAGDLNSANNYINVQYGSTNAKDVNQVKIKQQYGSGVTIATVGTLDIDAQYAAVNVGTVKGSAVVKQQYGSGVTFGTIGNLNVNAQYATVKIGTLKGNLISKQQYGKLIIDQTEAGKNIDVDSQYTTVDLGFADNYNGDFDVETSYANFKYGSNVTAKREGSDDEKRYSQNKRYSGQIGKGGSTKVVVKAQYYSVTFK